jgi:hypothetical protein
MQAVQQARRLHGRLTSPECLRRRPGAGCHLAWMARFPGLPLLPLPRALWSTSGCWPGRRPPPTEGCCAALPPRVRPWVRAWSCACCWAAAGRKACGADPWQCGAAPPPAAAPRRLLSTAALEQSPPRGVGYRSPPAAAPPRPAAEAPIPTPPARSTPAAGCSNRDTVGRARRSGATVGQ